MKYMQERNKTKDKNNMERKLELFFHKTIYLLPIFLMAVSFLSAFYKWFSLGIDYLFCPLQTWSTEMNYVVWGNVGGFSIICNLAFVYIFWFGKFEYCLFTKFSPFSLILVNLVNIWGFYKPEHYKAWYEIVIFTVTLTPLLIYELNRRIFK